MDAVPGAPLGLGFVPDFLSRPEHDDVVRHVISHGARHGWEHTVFRGRVARRLSLSFGSRYVATSRKLAATPGVAEFPQWLSQLRGRARALLGEGQQVPADGDFGHAIVWLYPTGSGIGFHADARVFGPVVFSISLGSTATIEFRRSGRETVKIRLTPGSLLVMAGEARADWQHRIRAVATIRYSITLRTRRIETVERGRDT